MSSELTFNVSVQNNDFVGQIRQMQQSLQQLDRQVQGTGQSLQKTQQSFQQVATANQGLVKQVDATTQSMTRQTQAADRMGASALTTSQRVRTVGEGMTLAGTAAVSLWSAYDNVTDASKRVEVAETRLASMENRLSKARERLTTLQNSGKASALDLAQAQADVAVAEGRVEGAAFNLTNAQEALNEAMLQSATSIIPSIFSGMSGISKIMDGLKGKAKAAADAQKELNTAMTDGAGAAAALGGGGGLGGVLGVLTNAAALLAGFAGGLAIVATGIKKIPEAAKGWDIVLDWFDKFAFAVGDIFPGAQSTIGQFIGFLDSSIKGIGDSIDGLLGQFPVLNQWFGTTTDNTKKQTEAQRAAAEENDKYRATFEKFSPEVQQLTKDWGLYYDSQLQATDAGRSMAAQAQEMQGIIDKARKGTIDLATANGVDLKNAMYLSNEALAQWLVNAGQLGPTAEQAAAQAAAAAKKFADDWKKSFEEISASMGKLNQDMTQFATTAFENMGGEMDVAAGHLKEKVKGSLGFNQDFWEKIFPRDVMHNVWEHNMDFDQLIADTQHIINRAVGKGFITKEQASKWFDPLLSFMKEDLPDDAGQAFGYLVSSIPELMDRLKPAIVRGFEIGVDVKEALRNNLVTPVMDVLGKELGAEKTAPLIVDQIKAMMPQIAAMSGPLAGMFKQALVDPLTQQERPVQEQVQRIVELLGEISPGFKEQLMQFDADSDGIADIMDKNILSPAKEAALEMAKMWKAIFSGIPGKEQIVNNLNDFIAGLEGTKTAAEGAIDPLSNLGEKGKFIADSWPKATQEINRMSDAYAALATNAGGAADKLKEVGTSGFGFFRTGGTDRLKQLRGAAPQPKEPTTTQAPVIPQATVPAPNTKPFTDAMDYLLDVFIPDWVAQIGQQLGLDWNFEPVKNAISQGLGVKLGEAVQAVIQGIPSWIQSMSAAFGIGWIFDGVKAVISSGKGSLAEKLGEGVQAIIPGISSWVKAISAGFGVGWQFDLAKTAISIGDGSLAGKIGEAVQSIIPGIGSYVTSLSGAFGVGWAFDAVYHALADDSEDTLLGKIKGGVQAAIDWVTKQGIPALQSAIGTLGSLSQGPQTAEGATADGGTTATPPAGTEASATALTMQPPDFTDAKSAWTDYANHITMTLSNIQTSWTGHITNFSAVFVAPLAVLLQTAADLYQHTLADQIGAALGGIIVTWSGHVSAVGGQVNAVGGQLIKLVQGYGLMGQSAGQALGGIVVAWGGHVNAVGSAVNRTGQELLKMAKGYVALASAGSQAMSHLANAVAGSMTRIRSAMNSATAAARGLQSAINALHDKTITVTTRYRTVGSRGGGGGGGGSRRGRLPGTGTIRSQHGFEGVVSQPTRFFVGEGNKPEHVQITPLAGNSNWHMTNAAAAAATSSIRAGRGTKKAVQYTEYYESGKKIIHYSDGSTRKSHYKIGRGEDWRSAVARDSGEPYFRDLSGRGDYVTPSGTRYKSEDMWKFTQEKEQDIIKRAEEKSNKTGKSEPAKTTYTYVDKKGKVKKKEVVIDPETGMALKENRKGRVETTISTSALYKPRQLPAGITANMGRYGMGGIWAHAAFGGPGDLYPTPIPPGFKKTLSYTYYPDGAVWRTYSDGSREMIKARRGGKRIKMKKAQHGYHGLVTSPTQFLAGEGGRPEMISIEPIGGGGSNNNNNSIGNIQSIVDTIVKSVSNRPVIIQIDGREIVRVVNNRQLRGYSSIT